MIILCKSMFINWNCFSCALYDPGAFGNSQVDLAVITLLINLQENELVKKARLHFIINWKKWKQENGLQNRAVQKQKEYVQATNRVGQVLVRKKRKESVHTER